MALIRSISQGNSNVQLNRTEADASVQTFDDPELGKIVHFATYGSDNRLSPPKVSQVVQFSQRTGLELLKILQDAFGTEGSQSVQ